MIFRYFVSERDFDDCVKTFIEVFNRHPWNDKWDYKKAETFLLDYVNHPSFVGFVYEENQKQIGYILGYIFKWWDINHYYINEFFIKSDYQKQGIGKFMLDEIKKILKKNNIGSMIVLTMKNTESEQFYLKHGFFHNDCMIQLKLNL